MAKKKKSNLTYGSPEWERWLYDKNTEARKRLKKTKTFTRKRDSSGTMGGSTRGTGNYRGKGK